MRRAAREEEVRVRDDEAPAVGGVLEHRELGYAPDLRERLREARLRCHEPFDGRREDRLRVGRVVAAAAQGDLAPGDLAPVGRLPEERGALERLARLHRQEAVVGVRRPRPPEPLEPLGVDLLQRDDVRRKVQHLVDGERHAVLGRRLLRRAVRVDPRVPRVAVRVGEHVVGQHAHAARRLRAELADAAVVVGPRDPRGDGADGERRRFVAPRRARLDGDRLSHVRVCWYVDNSLRNDVVADAPAPGDVRRRAVLHRDGRARLPADGRRRVAVQGRDGRRVEHDGERLVAELEEGGALEGREELRGAVDGRAGRVEEPRRRRRRRGRRALLLLGRLRPESCEALVQGLAALALQRALAHADEHALALALDDDSCHVVEAPGEALPRCSAAPLQRRGQSREQSHREPPGDDQTHSRRAHCDLTDGASSRGKTARRRSALHHRFLDSSESSSARRAGRRQRACRELHAPQPVRAAHRSRRIAFRSCQHQTRAFGSASLPSVPAAGTTWASSNHPRKHWMTTPSGGDRPQCSISSTR